MHKSRNNSYLFKMIRTGSASFNWSTQNLALLKLPSSVRSMKTNTNDVVKFEGGIKTGVEKIWLKYV